MNRKVRIVNVDRVKIALSWIFENVELAHYHSSNYPLHTTHEYCALRAIIIIIIIIIRKATEMTHTTPLHIIFFSHNWSRKFCGGSNVVRFSLKSRRRQRRAQRTLQIAKTLLWTGEMKQTFWHIHDLYAPKWVVDVRAWCAPAIFGGNFMVIFSNFRYFLFLFPIHLHSCQLLSPVSLIWSIVLRLHFAFGRHLRTPFFFVMRPMLAFCL